MSVINPFEERIEQFNKDIAEETEAIKRYKADKNARDIDDQEWEKYSFDDVKGLFSLSDEDTLKLLNSGLFKVYRTEGDYRAKKKSVEDSKNIIRTITTYRNKKTITVMEMARLLGLGKTSAYRLINQNNFKKYLVFGKVRVDLESFEEWYANQFHYEKITGERPGKNHGNTIAPRTVGKVLGISKSTAYDLLDRGKIETVRINGERRVLRESFDTWYKSQSRYKKVMEINEVERYVD